MKITTNAKNDRISERNTFGQHVTHFDETTYTTCHGTLDEALAYSHDHSCYIRRCAAVEHLIPAWDSDCRYIVLDHGKVSMCADRKADIPGFGYYVHEFIVEED